MFVNLVEYEGVWGDFGSHVDKYQGMVESVIKSHISLSDYFGGDVNEVYMYLYRQGPSTYLSGLKDRVPVGQDNFEHMTVLYYLTTVGQNYSFLRRLLLISKFVACLVIFPSCDNVTA